MARTENGLKVYGATLLSPVKDLIIMKRKIKDKAMIIYRPALF